VAFCFYIGGAQNVVITRVSGSWSISSAFNANQPDPSEGGSYSGKYYLRYDGADRIGIWDGSSYTSEAIDLGTTFTVLGIFVEPLAVQDLSLIAPPPVAGYSGLNSNHCPPVTFYAMIDGIPDVYWQYNSRGDAPSFSGRTVRNCLHVGGSYGSEFDPRSLVETPGSLSLWFDDIRDTDNKSYFGKLFSDTIWRTQPHTYLAESTLKNDFLRPNAVAIDVIDDTELQAGPAGAWLGYETISYQSKSSNSLIGVLRGLYPCVGSSSARSIPLAADDIETINTPVGNTGYYFMSGRRIALYQAYWDPDGWQTGELIYVGYITDFMKKNIQWCLACESILRDFDRPIFERAITESQASNLINLNYDASAPTPYLIIKESDDFDAISEIVIQLTPGIFKGPSALAASINEDIKSGFATGRTFKSTYTIYDSVIDRLFMDVGDGRIVVIGKANVRCESGRLVFIWKNATHFARALGYNSDDKIVFIEKERADYWDPDDRYYQAYHPMEYRFNGGKFYVRNKDEFTLQNNGIGFVKGKGKSYDGTEIDVHIAFNGKGSDTYGDYLSIASDSKITKFYDPLGGSTVAMAYLANKDIGNEWGKLESYVEQVIIPAYNSNGNYEFGPFETILSLILSNGYNGWTGEHDWAYLARLSMSTHLSRLIVKYEQTF
jgi:hypothetical protein